MVLKRQWMQKIHIFENEILEDESFETFAKVSKLSKFSRKFNRIETNQRKYETCASLGKFRTFADWFRCDFTFFLKIIMQNLAKICLQIKVSHEKKTLKTFLTNFSLVAFWFFRKFRFFSMQTKVSKLSISFETFDSFETFVFQNFVFEKMNFLHSLPL